MKRIDATAWITYSRLRRPTAIAMMAVFCFLTVSVPPGQAQGSPETDTDTEGVGSVAADTKEPENGAPDLDPEDQESPAAVVATPRREPSAYLAAESSRKVRADTKAGFGASAGTIVGSMFGAGLEGYWQERENIQLALSFGAARRDFGDSLREDVERSSLDLSQAEGSAQLILLQGRYFLGNSFFVGTGMGLRRIRVDLRVDDRLSGEYLGGDFHANSGVFHFSLGNRWTWPEGFVIGADWLAVTVPVSSQSEVNLFSSSSINRDLQDLQDDTESLMDKLGRSSSYQLALLYMGYTF